MDIDEINDHIHKLKFGSTDWQSVEKLAALCTVRNELEEKQAPAEMQTQALPPRRTRRHTQQKQIRKASSWKRPAPRPLEA